MNKQLNLCKILKGHKGETFYCTLFGNVKLHNINNNDLIYQIEIIVDDGVQQALDKYGRFIINEHGECVLFPSKDQRDWNKWVEEQKPKVSKTWSELVEQDKVKFQKAINIADKDISDYNAIEKSALALLKIHQLIEHGYGGNVSSEEWKLNTIKYIIDCNKNNFYITPCNNVIHHIAFHTREQAEEFLSKPENIQLLKDYFMI